MNIELPHIYDIIEYELYNQNQRYILKFTTQQINTYSKFKVLLR